MRLCSDIKFVFFAVLMDIVFKRKGSDLIIGNDNEKSGIRMFIENWFSKNVGTFFLLHSA